MVVNIPVSQSFIVDPIVNSRITKKLPFVIKLAPDLGCLDQYYLSVLVLLQFVYFLCQFVVLDGTCQSGGISLCLSSRYADWMELGLISLATCTSTVRFGHQGT